MEQCHSLKVLRFENDGKLSQDHCRALGAYSRPDLEIELKLCQITGAAAAVFAQVLARNQGPTKLCNCHIDNSVLADGLRGNSRLKSFASGLSNNRDVGNRELVAIAGALQENRGLVDLDLYHTFTISDETWGAVCDSLKTHSTLEVLNLWSVGALAPLASAVLMSRIQALVDMLKVNISIHTILPLRDFYSEHELVRESVIPYLETNRLRPRVRAIQKTRPMTYRAKVLRRALLATRTDASRFWMLLSGNAEVTFPSTTATTTLAANRLTPATAASTIVNVAHVVATTSATTASHVGTPTAGQKRKASL